MKPVRAAKCSGNEMSDNARTRNLLVGILGAAAGGLLGYFAFFWIARQGFYALMLPGGLVGLGGGLLARDRSPIRATICGLVALALGVFTEWRFAPFIKDTSLHYFLGHLHELRPITLLMIAVGGAFGYWLSLGREPATKASVGPPAAPELRPVVSSSCPAEPAKKRLRLRPRRPGGPA